MLPKDCENELGFIFLNEWTWDLMARSLGRVLMHKKRSGIRSFVESTCWRLGGLLKFSCVCVCVFFFKLFQIIIEDRKTYQLESFCQVRAHGVLSQ